MDSLFLFSAGSANDNINKHLWVKGASLIIPQLNKLLEHTNYLFQITDMKSFDNDEAEVFAEILKNNKSYKFSPNNYYFLYSYIIKKLGGKNAVLNTLEIGIGTNNPTLLSTIGDNRRPGASLYAFKEYLQNSNIHGADIDKDILFEEHRIKTCFVDQLDSNSFNEISNKFGHIKFDLIIDNGLHSLGANFNTLLYALKNLNNNGWLVIEDIQGITKWKAIDFILKSTNEYKTYIVNINSSTHLYVINKL